MASDEDTVDPYLGNLGQGVWLLDHPPCPRCGLRLHKDDPNVGYDAPTGAPRRMYLKHATSIVDTDGCIVGMGRAILQLAEHIEVIEEFLAKVVAEP